MSNDDKGFLRPALGARLADFLREAADMVEAGEPIPTGSDWVTITKDAAEGGVTRIQADIWLKP